MLTVKYGNEFFVKIIGLVTGHYMVMQMREPELAVDEFLKRIKKKNRYSTGKDSCFRYAYAR